MVLVDIDNIWKKPEVQEIEKINEAIKKIRAILAAGKKSIIIVNPKTGEKIQIFQGVGQIKPYRLAAIGNKTSKNGLFTILTSALELGSCDLLSKTVNLKILHNFLSGYKVEIE